MSSFDADPFDFLLATDGNDQVKQVSNTDRELYFQSQHMINGLQGCYAAYGPVVR